MKPILFDRNKHTYKNEAFVELVKDAIRFFNGTDTPRLFSQKNSIVLQDYPTKDYRSTTATLYLSNNNFSTKNKASKIWLHWLIKYY
jgi:hypothetical protein